LPVLLVAQDRVAAGGAEGLVVSGRFRVTPVEVRRIAHYMIRPLLGRIARVTKALDVGDGTASRAQARERACPDADPPDLAPAERAQEDRRRGLRRKAEDDGDAALLSIFLVLAFECLEDALAARFGIRRRVDGEAGNALLSAYPHAKQRVRRNPDDTPICARDRHQGAGRVVPEPPVELAGAQGEIPPCLAEQA
jgi:hypothetical protein